MRGRNFAVKFLFKNSIWDRFEPIGGKNRFWRFGEPQLTHLSPISMAPATPRMSGKIKTVKTKSKTRKNNGVKQA